MSIKLHFHGASRTVTGSSYVIETEQAHVMVDCGMFQGSKTESSLNYRPFACDPTKIHAMLLTHAHIDHSGLIPKLVKDGFKGRIHATAATADLCAVMLADSAHIQQMEVRNLNERKRRRGEEEVEPIYSMENAEAAVKLFTPHDYRQWVSPAPGMRARFWNAGHLLGSASIEVEVDQAGKPPLRILFSGDIGPEFKLLQPDPEAPQNFDYVLCESTYGAREREDRNEETRRKHLTAEVKAAIARGGVMLVPSFAVERTQELMTDLAILMGRGDLPAIPVFIDSPLAMRASRIFENHAGDMDNGKLLRQAFASADVRFMETVEDSKSINKLSGTYIIIAASGMCEAGRIRHHLRNRLWMAQTTVMLAGYQAEGTLGRMLENGSKRVRLMGEEVSVRAHITKIDDYSGHADGPELQAWVKARLPIARGIFLTHGEDPAQLGLAARLNAIVPAERIFRPSLDDTYELTGAEPVLVETTAPRRLAAAQVASVDWNNDLASLVLDLNEEIRKAADEKTRQKIIRRLRRALEEA